MKLKLFLIRFFCRRANGPIHVFGLEVVIFKNWYKYTFMVLITSLSLAKNILTTKIREIA